MSVYRFSVHVAAPQECLLICGRIAVPLGDRAVLEVQQGLAVPVLKP